MTQPRLKQGRLSVAASLLMLLLGVLAFILVNGYLGLALIILGLIMYLFNRRVRGHAAVDPKNR